MRKTHSPDFSAAPGLIGSIGVNCGEVYAVQAILEGYPWDRSYPAADRLRE